MTETRFGIDFIEVVGSPLAKWQESALNQPSSSGFLASFLLSRRALAMLLRRAPPESEIASSKTGIYFCTDP